MSTTSALASLDLRSQIKLLKVEASELATATVMRAMCACGLSGYRNDGFSVGCLLRDVLSAPILIILANIAPAGLMSRVPRACAIKQQTGQPEIDGGLVDPRAMPVENGRHAFEGARAVEGGRAEPCRVGTGPMIGALPSWQLLRRRSRSATN